MDIDMKTKDDGDDKGIIVPSNGHGRDRDYDRDKDRDGRDRDYDRDRERRDRDRDRDRERREPGGEQSACFTNVHKLNDISQRTHPPKE